MCASPVFAFAHHRGFTHSFLGLFLVCAVVIGFMYFIWRLRGRKTSIPNLPPRWGLLFLFAYIAGLSHILLDFTNNYGVRPFWPFWGTWYSWGVTFIIEPTLFVFLLAGLLLPALFSKQHVPRGAVAARLALACVAGLWCVRAYEIAEAKSNLEKQEFESARPVQVSVYPYWFRVSRLRIGKRWHVVVETQEKFVSSDVNLSTGELDPSETMVFSKSGNTPAFLAARQSYLGRVYLGWAGYPLTTESRQGRDTVVRFQDLRFDYPQLRGRLGLSGSVELDSNLHVISERWGNRQQSPPD